MRTIVLSFLSAFLITVAAHHAAAAPWELSQDHGGAHANLFFAAVLDAIGDDEAATVIISGGAFPIGDLTLPPAVTLVFRDGGRLVIDAGATLTINGAVQAGAVPIFSGEGTVAGRVDALHVLPQWFGAKGDGIHDDARAMQQAADLAATSTGRTLFIPEGDYLFHSDISFRCHVECRGRFIKSMKVNEERTQFSNDLFLPTHFPYTDAQLRFAPDHDAVALDPAAFYGIEEGNMTIPQVQDVPLADGSGAITLAEGGTLRFYSSDFFTSRRVRKGAHFYDRNDITQVVSGLGDVFPEFAFSYLAPPDAPAWDADTVYAKGDYCTHEGGVFKATWPSGPETGYTHRHLGAVTIGPVPPDPSAATTEHRYTYEDGTPDSIYIWRRVETRVTYRPPDAPITVRGLRMEVRLEGHEGEVKRLSAGAMTITRSNMTIHDMAITVRDPEATMSRLLQSSDCVNNVFYNGYFSGATSAHLGYNILNSNVANFRYVDCISTNSRKGMDGRHGKNITVQGGLYNVIDDHYGRNYVVRDVTLTGQSVFVPGDSTPNADLQAWGFRPRGVLNFNGAHFHIENITVMGGAGGVLAARSDVGDLYGVITLRDINIRGNAGNVNLYRHSIDPSFDFYSPVGVPRRLVIENVVLENPGTLALALGDGFGDRGYGPVYVRNAGPIGQVSTSSADTVFVDSVFEDTRFATTEDARVSLRGNVLSGTVRGLDPAHLSVATGNALKAGGTASFPIEYRNPEEYETLED